MCLHNSSFASPSLGGAAMLMSTASELIPVILDSFEFGFAFTTMKYRPSLKYNDSGTAYCIKQYQTMGNSCCTKQEGSLPTQQTGHTHSLKILSSQSIPVQFREDCDSEDSEELSPIPRYPSMSINSKVELDYTQSTLNSRRRQSRLESSLKTPLGSKMSIRIGTENFVTLRQRNVDEYYEFIKKLGQGSYGNVWKVRHKQSGLIRSAKLIKKSSLLLEDQERMLSEINILKQLDHPNIVKVYECYQSDLSYCIITEFLSGGELFNRIKNENYFSEGLAANYLRQIMRAVSYCHDKKIVHRDLKPENILFQSQDCDSQLKVIDFGTSRYFNHDQNMRKKLGTPYYIAPEVLSQNYNEKVDIWSCGVILYIFLCGYPPFNGKTDQLTLQMVRQGLYQFDRHDWALVSQDAIQLVQGMLQVDPVKRLSAKQVLEHPWVLRNTYPDLVNQVALQNLQKFQAQSYFKKAMLSYIVNQTLPSSDLKELENTFAALDKNQDGYLCKQELVEGYKRLIPDQSQAEQKVGQILNFVDINFSGNVDYSEFIMAAINYEKLVQLDVVKHAFKMLDLNNDGYLSKEEMEEAMGALGEDVWQQYLLDCDYNKDGKISLEEFTSVLLSKV